MWGPQDLGFKKCGEIFKVPENVGSGKIFVSKEIFCVQRNILCKKKLCKQIFCVLTKCCASSCNKPVTWPDQVLMLV